MNIGFTGTRNQLTIEQRLTFFKLIQLLGVHVESFYHGDCVGADSNAHDIIRSFPNPINIIIYPSNLNNLRAFKDGDFIYEPQDPLDRNKQIVDSVDLLIACPNTYDNVLRSGTWSTIRFAEKYNKEHYIIFPDGSYKLVEYSE